MDDAFIGKRIPKMMRPTIVTTLVTVSQNSISPYRRTLKRLKRTGITRNTEIQMEELYCSLGSQNVIMF